MYAVGQKILVYRDVFDESLPVDRNAVIIDVGYRDQYNKPAVLVRWKCHEIILNYKEIKEPGFDVVKQVLIKHKK